MKIEYGISYANVYNLEDVMLEAIKIRRSIRTYINKKVEEEKIEEILRAAMQAPSSKGACPWEFVVVDDNEVLEKLSKCQHRARHIKYANICIVVLGNKDKFIKPGTRRNFSQLMVRRSTGITKRQAEIAKEEANEWGKFFQQFKIED